MGDVRLTPQSGIDSGVTVVRTALSAANVYQVLLSPGGTWLNFVKTGANDADITVVTPGTVDGLAIADRVITVVATTGDVAAEFFPDFYANGDGDLEFATDEGTAITCAVLQR